jgi:hypothetical protein
MQTKTCNSVIWILVLLAILLLTLQGRVALLAVVLPISLLLACAVMRSGNAQTKLTGDREKG